MADLGWREVSKEEFFRVIGPQNVHPIQLGPYPYTSSFQTPYRVEVGRIVGYYPEGQALAQSRYLLPKEP